MPDVQKVEKRSLTMAEAAPASIAFELLLQGKWKLQILLVMCSGPVRLGRLARVIPGASKKVLAENLRKLQADGIVVRTDFSNVVLHVEYDLHPDLRASVCRLLNELGMWGDQYIRWSSSSPKAFSRRHYSSAVPVTAPPKTVRSACQSELGPLSCEQNALRYVTGAFSEAEQMHLSEADNVKVLDLLENPPAPNTKPLPSSRTRQRRKPRD